MTSKKALALFAALGIALIAAAWIITAQRAPSTHIEKRLLFPDLAARLNELARIEVADKTDKTILIKDKGDWRVENRDGYPATFENVKRAAVGIAELRVLAEKTNRPELYSRLQVEDLDAEDAKSKLVTLLDASGQSLAALLIGKEKQGRSFSAPRAFYVRKAGADRAMLVEGTLNISARPTDWVDTLVLDIDPDRMREIVISHQDGEQIRLDRPSPDDKDYELHDVPEDAQIKSQTLITSLATALDGLRFDDVLATESVGSESYLLETVYRTFDGLEVRVRLREHEDKTYAEFEAAYAPDLVWKDEAKAAGEAAAETGAATDADTGEAAGAAGSQADTGTNADADTKAADASADEKKPAETVAEEAERLQRKLHGWAYRLPEFKQAMISKRMDDLLKPQDADTEQPKPAEQTQAGPE